MYWYLYSLFTGLLYPQSEDSALFSLKKNSSQKPNTENLCLIFDKAGIKLYSVYSLYSYSHPLFPTLKRTLSNLRAILFKLKLQTMETSHVQK